MARRLLQQMRPRISMIRYESEQVNSQFSGSVPVFIGSVSVFNKLELFKRFSTHYRPRFRKIGPR